MAADKPAIADIRTVGAAQTEAHPGDRCAADKLLGSVHAVCRCSRTAPKLLGSVHAMCRCSRTAPSDSPPRALIVLVSGPGMIGDRPSAAFVSGQAAKRLNSRSSHHHRRQGISGLCQHQQTGTLAPVLGHAKEVVSLFVRHPHRRPCHDSGLRQLTTHQLPQLDLNFTPTWTTTNLSPKLEGHQILPRQHRGS